MIAWFSVVCLSSNSVSQKKKKEKEKKRKKEKEKKKRKFLTHIPAVSCLGAGLSHPCFT
jgi:hypothetical protein